MASLQVPAHRNPPAPNPTNVIAITVESLNAEHSWAKDTISSSPEMIVSQEREQLAHQFVLTQETIEHLTRQDA